MASPRPRGPPPLDPAAKPEVQPRYVDPHPRGPDPAGKPKVRPRDASPHPHGPPPLDPLGEPELHVSPDHPRRTHSIAKLFMSQFLDIPLRKSKPTVEQYSSVCIEKGFLSYFAHHPVIARISSDDPEPSNFDKLTAWFRKNAVTDDQYLKKFVKMVSELNGVTVEEFTSASNSPSMVNSVPSNPEIVKPGLSQALPLAPCPFPKLGKDAKDVLHRDYYQGPVHCEVRCKFSKLYKKDPSVVFKIRSTPSVKAILSQNQLWRSDLKGSVSLKLPFSSNTSKAEVQFLHENLSLNVSAGLHSEPHLKVAALAGSSQAAAGFCLGLNTMTGAVTDLDVGGSVSIPVLGTFSTVCELAHDGLLDAKHGAYKAYFSKKHQKNTYAVEMEYKLVEKEKKDPVHTVVGSAGVLHQFDSGLILKAKVSSSGHASGMIQFSEGLADSIVGATVQVDLRHLDRPPRVGFSISSDPTK